MGLNLFNTLTGKKENFEPLKEDTVGMYVCGITTYDDSHLGHARAYVAFDIIKKYLEFKGYKVKYVRNFTDIDDKIIKRANELGIETPALAEKYIKEFHNDMALLEVEKADIEPKATEHINEMIEMIQRIINNGFAYVTPIGNVYFSIENYEKVYPLKYGILSHKNIDELLAGARVELEEDKKFELDFVLWKTSKPFEPWWESPWGKGRPGWHIECSAMSSKYLGKTFDIHGGGADLIFPHHENEIAQSRAAFATDFVRFWLHNGFVKVQEEKMSKSLGNFFTVKDVLNLYHPEAIRYFLISTHYRSPINYTDANLEEAQKRIEYIYESIKKANTILGENANLRVEDKANFEILKAFKNAMDDDFNTAMALGIFSDALRKLNELTSRTITSFILKEIAKTLYEIQKMGKVLAIANKDPQKVLSQIMERKIKKLTVSIEEIEELIQKRESARKKKDFKTADEIREKLLSFGVVIMDTLEGTKWKLK